MILTAEHILLTGAILLFVSIIACKTGYRFGVPTLLLFLGVGMLFGSDLRRRHAVRKRRAGTAIL